MNYLTLALIALAGIIIGSYFGKQKNKGPISKQSKLKKSNKQAILRFLQSNDKVRNNDVEELCQVSNATAERYLDQLEKTGKLTQHGEIGRDVYYTLN